MGHSLQHPDTPLVHHLSTSNPITALPPPSRHNGFVSTPGPEQKEPLKRTQRIPQRRIPARLEQGIDDQLDLETVREATVRGEESACRRSKR